MTRGLTLHIEVRADTGVGQVEYRTWELPLRVRGRRAEIAEAEARELDTPLGLQLAVVGRWWPGAGGNLSVRVAGQADPLVDVAPLVVGTWVAIRLPTGERHSIRAREQSLHLAPVARGDRSSAVGASLYAYIEYDDGPEHCKRGEAPAPFAWETDCVIDFTSNVGVTGAKDYLFIGAIRGPRFGRDRR